LRDADNKKLAGNFLRPSWKGLAALCVLAAFLTFTGVYDAVKSMPIWWGWGYWIVTLIVGCLVGYGVILGMRRFQVNDVVRFGLSSLASTAGVTAVIYAIHINLGQTVALSFIPGLFLQVLVISIVVFTLGILWEQASRKTYSDTPSRDPIKHFLEHLPMKYRDTELYAVSSEDHYLRVHTSKGEELILMRLSDAIHALKEADGLQTHRSWWVGSAGVSELRRDNGKVEILLKSGAAAPVSRTYQSAIKDANWF